MENMRSAGIGSSGLHESFEQAMQRFYGFPERQCALTVREHQLIGIALEATATQLDPSRLSRSIREALSSGVTIDEVVFVIERVSIVGVHALSVGGPILCNELRERGLMDAELDSRRREARRRFEDSAIPARSLSRTTRSLLELDPEYFEAFNDMVAVSWSMPDIIDARLNHLISLAIDATCSHLYEEGIGNHIRGALDNGASPAEIIETLQLAAQTGLRSIAAMVQSIADVNV